MIAQLSEKFVVSERGLWSDWERRQSWVPVLLGLGKYAGFAEEVGQKLNAVEKAAWTIYLNPRQVAMSLLQWFCRHILVKGVLCP